MIFDKNESQKLEKEFSEFYEETVKKMKENPENFIPTKEEVEKIKKESEEQLKARKVGKKKLNEEIDWEKELNELKRKTIEKMAKRDVKKLLE